MPTSRKRIGFLPSEEVKEIIDKICLTNNLSQSKVTGILVKEALKARNLYQFGTKEDYQELSINEDFYKTKLKKNIDLTEDKEYKLIKEYLNYKNFKKILSVVEKEI